MILAICASMREVTQLLVTGKQLSAHFFPNKGYGHLMLLFSKKCSERKNVVERDQLSNIIFNRYNELVDKRKLSFVFFYFVLSISYGLIAFLHIFFLYILVLFKFISKLSKLLVYYKHCATNYTL